VTTSAALIEELCELFHNEDRQARRNAIMPSEALWCDLSPRDRVPVRAAMCTLMDHVEALKEEQFRDKLMDINMIEEDLDGYSSNEEFVEYALVMYFGEGLGH
jgi:hypothetical protein